MQFIIKQVTDNALSGDVRVIAADAREALDIVADMRARGAVDIEILDLQDKRYDAADLESLCRNPPDFA